MPSNQNSTSGTADSSNQGSQRRANSGQFKKGDPRTREAGRKGGSVSSSGRNSS